jgi:hypothetical protein
VFTIALDSFIVLLKRGAKTPADNRHKEESRTMEITTPLSFWVQLGSFFFLMSGLYADLLVIRLSCHGVPHALLEFCLGVTAVARC